MSDYISYTYLIVGGGMVADNAARGIREIDTDGSIGIVAREATPPAARPALSKKLWTDPSFSFDDIWLNTEADTGAVRHSQEVAVDLDPAAHSLRTDSGTEIHYERLLLATGASPNTLDLPPDERIIHFRSVDDYRKLRSMAGDHRRIAVVGGSFIATELAAALVQNNTDVTLIYPESVLGEKFFPGHLAESLEGTFRDNGVELKSGTSVDSAEVGDDGIHLKPSSGEAVGCSAVAAGVGVSPDTGLAESAGLSVGDGIEVDERLRTGAPDIIAAGDVASYPDVVLGRTRVEHVDNANEMGRQAGRNLAGADEPYTHTPYFYSVLFDNRYEAVGVLDSSLETVEEWHGDKGVVHYIDAGRVVGVLLWNVSGRRDAARDAIANADASDSDARDQLRTRIGF